MALGAAQRWDACERLRLTAGWDYGQQHPQHYLGTPVFQGAPAPGTRRVSYNVLDNRHYFENQWLPLAMEWQLQPKLALASTVYRC